MNDNRTQLEKCLMAVIQDYSTFLKVKEEEKEELMEKLRNITQMHTCMQFFVEDMMDKTEEEACEDFEMWFDDQDVEDLKLRARRRWAKDLVDEDFASDEVADEESEEDETNSEPEVKFYTIEDILKDAKNNSNEN